MRFLNCTDAFSLPPLQTVHKLAAAAAEGRGGGQELEQVLLFDDDKEEGGLLTKEELFRADVAVQSRFVASLRALDGGQSTVVMSVNYLDSVQV